MCAHPKTELPVLVMECLPLCLDGLLENTRDITLAVKRSILCDVARGLTYLHSKTPPIIHRDFTAKNVLLNSSMVAKIADLGVARILNLRPGQMAATNLCTSGLSCVFIMYVCIYLSYYTTEEDHRVVCMVETFQSSLLNIRLV